MFRFVAQEASRLREVGGSLSRRTKEKAASRTAMSPRSNCLISMEGQRRLPVPGLGKSGREWKSLRTTHAAADAAGLEAEHLTSLAYKRPNLPKCASGAMCLSLS
jgi:hypothetical protein